MTALCVVQARTGSTRLPGKVLLDLGGRPVLALLLQRLQRGPYPVVVATSTAPGDDGVVRLAEALDVPTVRGPEADVLERFRVAADTWPDADPIIRITADCPFTDPDVVQRGAAVHARMGADYTSNTLARTFPDGLDVEFISRWALLVAAAEATRLDEREHVTPFIQRRPDRFRLAAFCSGEDLGDVRLTLDTAADMEVLKSRVQAVPDAVNAPWQRFVGERSAGDGVQVRPRCTDGPLEDRRLAVVVDGRQVAELIIDMRPEAPVTVNGEIPDDLREGVLRGASAWLSMDVLRGPLTSLGRSAEEA